MKKTTYVTTGFVVLFLLLSIHSFAQNYVPFTPRFNQDLKGDIQLIGNNILGSDNNAFNDNTVYNHNVDMMYIDIDGDPSTFSSSSADLGIPNPGCYEIIHAGLYWGAVTNGTESITDIKFRGPSGGYNDIVGTVIFEANGTSVDGGDSFSYACYADVTSIVTSLTADLGTYTVANVSSAQGETENFTPRNGTGYSAGWSLFIVYEDPTLPGKSITSFDGFSAISVPGGNPSLDIPVSGFRTIPAPAPVRANFAFATLEGDSPILGDRLLLNGVSLSTADRPATNFFNSSVTQLSATPVNNRNPNSTNTLGFDTGVMVVPNPGNTVIANDATSATVRLETSGDTYFPYFYALAVDIIEPNVVLTKIVEDASGNNIEGQLVDLGDELNYVIGFQNTGNDDATNLIIRDVLPTNIVFNYPTDMGLLPSGVTVQSYDIITRELIFSVNNSVVEENDPLQEIRFKVTVVQTCSLLSDACSNIISNQAFSTYNGTLNPTFTISDDPSFNTNTGCLLAPGATNFLADINCTFNEQVILCGASITLTAANGYDSYSWSTSSSGTPVIGTTQTITVTSTGTYYVSNTAIAPCQSIEQEFEVVTFGANVTNPVIPYADEVVTCPNDGKLLPNFYLCGSNDLRYIQTGVTNTASMIWERLDETSCTAVVDQDCANEDAGCTWNQVTTGPDFLVETAGQYRLTLNYQGGCFNQFYFNVYTNLLIPTVTSRDIICTTPGEIVVGGVPSGYEYSIDDVSFQTSNTFSITTPNIYSVYVRQIGVTPNPCIFSVPDVQIRERDFTVSTIITQPYCNGELGSVILAANDVRPQYFFSIYDGATLVNSVGPITENNYTFANLNPGTYTVNVSTEDGCTYTGDIDIIDPPLLTATSALTTPLTCIDGEITVYPVGGTPPYYYFVNSTTVFQSTPIISVSTSGVYNITVIDSNNCSADTSITVNAIPAPDFTVSKTDILCYNDNSGQIQFNVTNANGYTIEYSIDNGVTDSSNPTFSNLIAGTYTTNIKYSLNGIECFSTSQDITIIQPDDALTASAGVSELSGCGPAGEGKLRITNPQGGTPFPSPNFYEYSFDNQATWVVTNEANVSPGTYTLYIRDANGCIYAMTGIILDPEPVSPTITIDDPDFNCDGTAISTVVVNNTGGASFEYTYSLDGVENTNIADPTTFLDVPQGSHTITIQYALLDVPTFSNLLYENFGYGEDTTSPGVNSTYYCFERQVAATQCKNNIRIQDGDYSVTANIISPYSAWSDPGDHTPATIPSTPDGRYLVVNIGATIPVTATLYEKDINDIIPNQPINVEFFAANLLKSTDTRFDPNLTVALVDGSGTEISSFSTGDIPKSEQWENYPKTAMTLDPGSNTSLKFVVRSNVQQVSGNDVAIDDIRVFQLPISCVTEVNIPFVIDSNKAFTPQIQSATDVTCFNAADGTITLDVQNFDTVNGYQYSIDNGGTWNTQMTSPYTITGLPEGSYTVQIRYEDALDTCLFSFNQDIIAAAANLDVTVSGTPITCLIGSTVTAVGTGGTLAYSYELLDTATLSLITNFPSNGVLTDVISGDYTIRITDSNGCTDTAIIVLSDPIPPTANIVSDFCYDNINGFTLEVNAAGGQTPYEYSLNGASFVIDNTFSNLIPGNYTVTVRDAYGCTVTLPTETFASQLLVSTILTKDLDCTASPDGVVTGNISGGTAPFNYQVSFNSGTYGSLTPVTGTSFTHTASTDGTYQFLITDANGCTVESGVQTINVISLPEITLVVQTQPILCNGDDNAAIQITINNTVGTSPFLLNVFNTTTGIDYGTQTSGLAAGDYTITLTDSKSCTDTETITITEPTSISVAFTLIPITCDVSGVSSGEIIIDNVTGGTAPYDYYITGTNGYSNSSIDATGLAAISFSVIDFGLYQINVVDANGCSILYQDVLVASPPDDLDIIPTLVLSDCSTGGEVRVDIGTTLASSGPFFFALYRGPGTIYPNPIGDWIPETSIGSKNATFTGLTPGVTYTFIVYDDSTGCSYYETAGASIPTNSTLIANALTSSNITCVGSDDGNVSFTINSIYVTDTNVTYEIYDSLSLVTTLISGTGIVPAGASLSITDLGLLPFGNYFVLVTETSGANLGCSVITVPFNITESAVDLNISATVDKNANCNPNSGLISAIARDGTAPYLYQLTTSATPPLATDLSWGSISTFNVGANSYYVHVIDTYGCIKSTPVLVLPQDPEPVINVVLNNQCTVTEGNFEIDVTLTTAGIAPYSFSIDGGVFQTRTPPFTISNLSSGLHTVEVQDANGCGNLVNVNIETPLGLTPTITTLPSCTDDDGEITVTAFGGTGIYNFSISPNPSSSISLSGNVFSNVPSGTYTVTLTDVTTGCTEDVEVTLTPATPVLFTANPTDVSCNGSSDGSITVDLPASNDNPIYTYEITAGPTTVASQNSNIFTGLSVGTYTVQVISGRGCFTTEDIVVGEPDVITVQAPIVIEYACVAGGNTTNFASITVNSVIGGSGVYTIYEFIKSGITVKYGSDNSYTEADLSGGTYTINVYDDKGCLGTTTGTIQPFIELDTLDITIDNAITCTNDEDITVSVTSTGGTPTNLQYTVEDVDGSVTGAVYSETNVTGIFIGLPISNYIITVVNLDSNCSLQTVHYVNEPNTFDLTIDNVIDVTCFGDSNGSVDITFIDRAPLPTDESGAFDYTIVDSIGNPITTGSLPNAGPTTISGLAAGIYTITATLINTPFCTISKNFTITAPTATLAITETHTEITCINEGSISASATGGWPGGYEFQLEDIGGTIITAYSDVFDFTGLQANDYIVRVRDSEGCIASTNIPLVNPSPINATVTPSISTLSCFGDTNAEITVSAVTGGQGSNYTYTLNMTSPTVSSSGPQISPVFEGLGAGTYTILVTDGYSCSFNSLDIVITEPTQIQASLVKDTSQTCFTSSILTLSATGGTGSYDYSDTASFTTVLGSFTTPVAIPVTTGTFQYYVRDTNGCISDVSNEITIDPLLTLIVNLDVTNATINCAGDNTGVIVATAEGGLGSYVYTLQDTSGNNITPVTQDNPGVFTDLPIGNYQVRVDSGDCLTTSAQIPITEPTVPLTASFVATDVTCPGTNNGQLVITASGGTGIIKYAISPRLDQFFDSSIFENLAPGNYQAIAQDELGCFVIDNFIINAPVPVILSLVPNSIISEACEGDLDGEFSIDISGGEMPYSVSLDDINGTYTIGTLTQTQFDFIDLAGGDHIVYVRDNLGCETEWNITFPESVRIDAEIDIAYCTDNTDASSNLVTVTVDDILVDLIDLDYALDGGTFQLENIFIDVAPGNHFITVRHTNTCEQIIDFEIEQYDALQLAIANGGINEIVATATGGSGIYEYEVQYEFDSSSEPYGNTNTFIIYKSGNYTVTVTDSNGCVAVATGFFEYIDVCITNYFTPNGDGNMDQWGPGCTNQYRDLTFSIFDRYGRKIATLRIGQKWDGKYKGVELPTGDYWYVVKLNDQKDDREFVGHFTLYR